MNIVKIVVHENIINTTLLVKPYYYINRKRDAKKHTFKVITV